MTKQTPEQFAKNVFWQLAGIRADIDQLLSARVLEISAATRVAPKEVRKAMAAKILKAQKKLFAEMVESADLR